VTTKEHLALLDKQVAAHEKQIKAIRELVHEGMRLVVATRKDKRDLRKDMRDLVAIQKDVLGTLRRGPNGYSKKKLDVQ